jgi:hypothetical protein
MPLQFTFNYLSNALKCRFRNWFKRISDKNYLVVNMFKGNCGKLMVYASNNLQSKKRLDSVKYAAKTTAKRLNLDFEMVRFDKAVSPIYVYYEENDGKEPIPLYCDEGKISNLDEISCALRKMMFVLSFHPNHSVLKEIRSQLIKFS